MNGVPPPASRSRDQPAAESTYEIRHLTEYVYSETVAVCHNQIRMQPVDGGNLTCERSELSITPEPTSRDEHTDYFGNRVITFSIEATHKSLEVDVRSRVRVRPPSITAPKIGTSTPTIDWKSLALGGAVRPILPGVDEHRFRSARISPSPEFARYAATSFTPGRGVIEAGLDLTQRIHRDFRYDSTATSVDTTTEEAFELKAGVCQDFAHVQIACLRSIGLAARYVSGYLRTTPPPGKPRLIGADESHAWLEIYLGPDRGWLGLDPTNGTMIGTDHVPVCVGRDYDDVSPMRGVALGGGTHTLRVSVDVESV